MPLSKSYRVSSKNDSDFGGKIILSRLHHHWYKPYYSPKIQIDVHDFSIGLIYFINVYMRQQAIT